MSHPSRLAMAFVLLTCLSTGCADEGSDAGDDRDGDAGPDAGSSMDGGAGLVRPRGGQQIGDEPVEVIPQCDRFNPLACSAGRTCQLLVSRAPDQDQFSIRPGCVRQPAARGEGDPCEPWGGLQDPYEAPGLREEVHLNPCEAGLLCAPDPTVRGATSCQRACASGRTGEPRSPCPSSQYCYSDAPIEQSLFQEVCRLSDDCDPADPAACGPGAGCFVRFNDDGSGVLALCLPLSDAPLEDGAECEFVNHCRAGSACWGPAGAPLAAWHDGDLRCRRLCSDPVDGNDGSGVELPMGQQDGSDGGADDWDAGMSPSAPDPGAESCPGEARCVSQAGAGLDLSAVSAPFGQCE